MIGAAKKRLCCCEKCGLLAVNCDDPADYKCLRPGSAVRGDVVRLGEDCYKVLGEDCEQCPTGTHRGEVFEDCETCKGGLLAERCDVPGEMICVDAQLWQPNDVVRIGEVCYEVMNVPCDMPVSGGSLRPSCGAVDCVGLVAEHCDGGPDICVPNNLVPGETYLWNDECYTVQNVPCSPPLPGGGFMQVGSCLSVECATEQNCNFCTENNCDPIPLTIHLPGYNFNSGIGGCNCTVPDYTWLECDQWLCDEGVVEGCASNSPPIVGCGPGIAAGLDPDGTGLLGGLQCSSGDATQCGGETIPDGHWYAAFRFDVQFVNGCGCSNSGGPTGQVAGVMYFLGPETNCDPRGTYALFLICYFDNIQGCSVAPTGPVTVS